MERGLPTQFTSKVVVLIREAFSIACGAGAIRGQARPAETGCFALLRSLFAATFSVEGESFCPWTRIGEPNPESP